VAGVLASVGVEQLDEPLRIAGVAVYGLVVFAAWSVAAHASWQLAGIGGVDDRPSSVTALAGPAVALAGLRLLLWTVFCAGFLVVEVRQPLVALAVALTDAAAVAVAVVVAAQACGGPVDQRATLVAVIWVAYRTGFALASVAGAVPAGAAGFGVHAVAAVVASTAVAGEFLRAARGAR
jgi:hypothetical protein